MKSAVTQPPIHVSVVRSPLAAGASVIALGQRVEKQEERARCAKRTDDTVFPPVGYVFRLASRPE